MPRNKKFLPKVQNRHFILACPNYTLFALLVVKIMVRDERYVDAGSGHGRDNVFGISKSVVLVAMVVEVSREPAFRSAVFHIDGYIFLRRLSCCHLLPQHWNRTRSLRRKQQLYNRRGRFRLRSRLLICLINSFAAEANYRINAVAFGVE